MSSNNLTRRMRRAFERKSTSAEILEAVRLAPDNQELIKLYFVRKEEEREASGLNALMKKFNDARTAGLDLNEADKSRLLALLLDQVLEGTIGHKPISLTRVEAGL